MNRARRAVMLSLLALTGALLAAGCESIIGADGDYKDVVDDLCFCIETSLNIPDCRSKIGPRFASATPDVVDAWLSTYIAGCRACSKASECYYLDPACSHAACSGDDECCSHVCEDHECVEP